MTHDPVQQAQNEIAAILKRVEEETGQVVKSIELEEIEVTALGEPKRRNIAQIKIGLYRFPARDWI